MRRLIGLWGLLLLGLMLGGCFERSAPRQRPAPKASASRNLDGTSTGSKRAAARRMSQRERERDLSRKLAALNAPSKTAPKAANAPTAKNTPTPASRSAGANVPRGPPTQQVADVTIKNFGDVIYRGPVDLRPTIRRILAGERDRHRNDGGMFRNREGRLPKKSRAYYREYVHRTPGIDGPGPQRLVVGRDGDWWYTPDHYKSFIALQ